MFKKLVSAIVLVALVAVGFTSADFGKNLSAFAVNEHENGQIDICHYTPSHWVANSPQKSGSVGGHDGDINDIIPPFDYWVHISAQDWELDHYDGKNWDTNGELILNNECEEPSATPTPTVTPTPTDGGNTDNEPSVTPTVTPTPTEGQSQTNNNTSTSDTVTPRVGGASAVNPDPSGYAGTGAFGDSLANIMLVGGSLISGISAALYGKKKKAIQK